MNNTRREAKPSWEQGDYQRLESVAFDGARLHVRFANGDEIEVEPTQVVRRELATGADWAAATVDGPEIAVPTDNGPIGISWLDLRALTDPAFSAHLAQVADEEARQVGQQIRYLRESRDLSSAELARRAQITAQSLSRIELGRHDVVYSTLQRLLAAMNYTLADLAQAPAEAIEAETIARRLRKVGLPTGLVKRLVPTGERPSRILDRLHRIFGWSGADLASSETLPIRASVALAAQFKTTIGQHPELGPYVLYAHYLAGLVYKALPERKPAGVPSDPQAIRDEVLNEEEVVDFAALLRWSWGQGVAVLPLFDPGQFHGACWLFDVQPVIVLKQVTDSDARMAYDLAHELAHVALHLSPEQPAVIESEEISFDTEDESLEDEAADFAGAVLLGDPEALAQDVVRRASGNVRFLQRAVKEVAPQARVSVGALANYLAWRVEDEADWWGAAANLQQRSKRPAQLAVDMVLEHLDLERLADDDRALLLAALEEAS
jgi:transcriptional regulator with XRE-family HTH domain/Zn-dependent peptidase ImmA (M78 family)